MLNLYEDMKSFGIFGATVLDVGVFVFMDVFLK